MGKMPGEEKNLYIIEMIMKKEKGGKLLKKCSRVKEIIRKKKTYFPWNINVPYKF